MHTQGNHSVIAAAIPGPTLPTEQLGVHTSAITDPNIHEERRIQAKSKLKGGGPHLSLEKRTRIIASLNENPNSYQVAQKIGGVSDTSVRRIAKKEGIELTGNSAESKAQRVAEKHAKIIKALEIKSNAMQVARQMGMSDTAIAKVAHKAGIELADGKAIRGGPLLSSERQKEIIHALRANPNAREVARAAGDVRYIVVLRLAKAAGIDFSTGRTFKRGPRLTEEKRQEIIAALKICSNAILVATSVKGVGETTVRNVAQKEGIKLIDGIKNRGKSSLTSPRVSAATRSGIQNAPLQNDIAKASEQNLPEVPTLTPPLVVKKHYPPPLNQSELAQDESLAKTPEMGDADQKWGPILVSLEQLKDKVKKKTASYPATWNEPREAVADHLIALIQQLIKENRTTVLGMSEAEKDSLCAQAITDWPKGTSQNERQRKLPILSALNNLLYLDLGRPLFPQRNGGNPVQFTGSHLPYSF